MTNTLNKSVLIFCLTKELSIKSVWIANCPLMSAFKYEILEISLIF
jgi:hypothetical protein